jgi:predicted RNase H-like nuclease (RuvC/YqgF family)
LGEVRGLEQWAITTAITLGIGVIPYFLKRTMSRVDKNEDDIGKLKEDSIKRPELKENISELKSEIKQIREDYTPKETHEKDFDECKNEIKQIKSDYIMKEDFYRELNKVDRKLDYITDILMGLKGKGE